MRFFRYLSEKFSRSLGRIKRFFCCKKRSGSAQALRGKFGEDAACEFLRHHGFKIIRRNWRVKHREIDVIAIEKCSGVIVFVEVKLRSPGSYITGYSAVSKKKRATLKTACLEFLKKFCKKQVSYRFDIIEISYDETTKTKNIHHYENVTLF